MSPRTARTPDALQALLQDPAIRAVIVEMGPATMERAAVIQSVKARFPGMQHINLSTSLCTPKTVMLEQFQRVANGK